MAVLAANKPESFTVNEVIEFTDLSMPSAVLELITRLRAAEKDAKTWEESAQSLATQDNSLIAEMSQQAIEAEEAITELQAKLEAAENNYQLLKAVFVVNMIRQFPRLSHEQIKAEIDTVICKDLAMKEKP